MAGNPCPCTPLQNGVKLFAIIDAVFSALTLVLCVSVLLAILFYNGGEYEFIEIYKGHIVAVSGIVLLIASLQFLLAVRLHYGAKNKDCRKCMSWLAATFFITAILILTLPTTRTSDNFQVARLTVTLVFIVYKVFGIVLVSQLFEVMRRNNRIGSGYRCPPVVAHQSQPFYPGDHVYTIDLPPSYFDIQNQAAHVDSPPPYSDDSLAVPQNGIPNSGV